MIGTKNKDNVTKALYECASDFIQLYQNKLQKKAVEVNPWLVWKHFDTMVDSEEQFKKLQVTLGEVGIDLEKQQDQYGYKFTVKKK